MSIDEYSIAEFLSKRNRELSARLAQGVGFCFHCWEKPIGFCLTCNVLLCEEHDTMHLRAPNGKCEEVPEETQRKVQLLRQHIADARAKSPDGMTSWDRVEKHLREKGHLPMGNGRCELCDTQPKAGEVKP